MVEVLTKQALGGRYKVTEVLGTSIFSDTYLAKDQQLPNRPLCVVKCLKAPTSEHFDWEHARELFNAEAQALYRLSPHSSQIPRLLAHFEENHQFYLVHNYVEGHNLSQELIVGQPMPEAQVITLIQDVLSVLAIVHAQGVIHRDIKPHNLIRRDKDGKIVLIDFGAVKELSNQAHPEGQTTESILIGTPGYMAGEQRAGKPRYCSDIYSVGMLAIQAITGLNPKEIGEDIQGELCWRQVAKVSPRLATILTQMVRSHWRDRYQSVEEVLTDLNQLQKTRQPRKIWGIPQTVTLIAILALSFTGVRQKDQIQAHLKSLLMPVVVTPLAKGDIAPTRTINQSGSILALAMHPKGEIVVSGGQNKVIQLWDMKSGASLTALTGHLQEITSLHFTPTGETLVSASADSTLKVWNLQSGILRHTLAGHTGRVNSVHVTPNGKLTVSGGSDRQIKVWDLQTGSELQRLSGHTNAVNQIEITTDSRFIVSASEDKTVKIWDFPTGQISQTLVGHESGVKVVNISPNNQILATGADDQIMIWNVATGQRLRALPKSKSTRSLAFSNDGKYLLSAHADGTLKLWNWQKGALLKTVRVHSDSVGAIVICPNNRTLVTGSLDHRLEIWKMNL
ncbi:MAG: serine/threonine protein kinase [Timaviella obliquedivisa GSE-PSE-MK23-08B]|jgi:WD40 repeat protein/tRNA A-37 threonylcarbamoyl transferase component Bud32|nr:serine/threonine protein kinase [Timaviella obliquedivisa GSE-PSE-MK23-08B]